MKISEIVTESARGRLKKSARASIPDMEAFPVLDNNNNPYLAYRFGIALAGSPDVPMDKRGPVGSQFTTIGYSDADNEIIRGAAKQIGAKSHRKTSKKSTEADGTYTQSPVQPKGPVKRKNK